MKVNTLSVTGNLSGLILKISCDQIARSASLPFVRVPYSFSNSKDNLIKLLRVTKSLFNKE